MQTSPAAAIIVSVLMLLGVRFLFAMTVASYQSRKAHRLYQSSVPFWDRWFFLSAPSYVRDKYSKLERKVIKARALVRTLQVMNFILHMLLIPVVSIILLHVFGAVDGVWADRAFWAYFIVCGLCALILALIEWAYHPNFERMRYGRKPHNW